MPITPTQFQPILDAVQLASSLCRRVQQTDVIPAEKPGREPVTIADYGSQAILCRAVALHFPDDGMIAEESSAQFLSGLQPHQRQRVVTLVSETLRESVTEAEVIGWMDYGRNRDTSRKWVIDPIDGTKGFLGQRRYTIAIGLLENHRPIAGALGSPGYSSPSGLGRMTYALNGEAWQIDLAGREATRIQVSKRLPSDGYITAESFESDHADHAMISGIYEQAGVLQPIIERMDGQDKYAMIAAGEADVYLRLSPKRDYKEKIWDHAAGVAVIEAAGGRVTDMYGNALDFSLGQQLDSNTFVVVSNGQIHDALVQAIQAAYA